MEAQKHAMEEARRHWEVVAKQQRLQRVSNGGRLVSLVLEEAFWRLVKMAEEGVWGSWGLK